MGRKQDFSQSTIYHIRVIETKMVAYVGSTTNFKQRCATHKYDCNHDSTSPIYKFIRDNGGFVLFEIIPVAFLQLNSSIELRMEEQKEMDKHTDKLNAMKAYISEQERIDRNKEIHRKYYEQNKDKYTEYHKEYKKQYKEQNKERLKEQDRQYREVNKEIIKEKRKQHNKEIPVEFITCECGCVIKKYSKTRHLKNDKHKSLMSL